MNETETPVVEPTEAAAPRAKISIDNIEYFVDTLPQAGHQIINHIQIVDEEIQNIGKQKAIAELAKQKLVNDLSAITDQFEAVPVAETAEEATEAEDTPAA